MVKENLLCIILKLFDQYIIKVNGKTGKCLVREYNKFNMKMINKQKIKF